MDLVLFVEARQCPREHGVGGLLDRRVGIDPALDVGNHFLRPGAAPSTSVSGRSPMVIRTVLISLQLR